jgi:copper homeostasis protein
MLEVCANSFESAKIAEQAGAKRIELCDNLPEGGTTPSYAQIALSKQKLAIEIWPIIRPRGGDFLYNDLEFQLMKEDIKICKSLNCDGIVFGILYSDGTIDIERCTELVALAKPMRVTFHRAFDHCKNQFVALEEIINMGFVRILTSGGANTAIEGAEQIAKLIKHANNRISIMPGAGINANNLIKLIEITGAKEFHGTFKKPVLSKMQYITTKNFDLNTLQYELTSYENVREIINILKNKS